MCDDEERIAWDRAWRAMPHHRLLRPPSIDVSEGLAGHFGDVVAVTISLVPPEYCQLFDQRVAPQSEACAVCGEETSKPTLLSASLNVTFEIGFHYGLGAWVHRSCFESCPEAGKPPPIPW
jgi:hypothetical protein